MNDTKPRRAIWPVVLVYVILTPTMLWLGNWQLDKYHFRTAQLASFESVSEEAVALENIEDPIAVPFSRVVITGQFNSDRQILIDNIVRESRNGFYVVTPFRMDDNRLILVNRGWIPQTADRKPIGNLEIDGETIILTGRIGRLPTGGLKLGEQPTTVSIWPTILQYPTIADVSTLLDETLVDWALQLDSPESAGFEQDWKPGGLPPERHLGYAVQWFALTVALTLLMLIAWRKRGHTENNDDD
ncbi:MAG: SURF1 family protein [Woeseiaceae bacterium]